MKKEIIIHIKKAGYKIEGNLKPEMFMFQKMCACLFVSVMQNVIPQHIRTQVS